MRLPAIVFVLIGTLLLTVCCTSERNNEKDEQSKREQQEGNVLRELAAKYGASLDWRKKVDEKEKPLPYSVDMEEALIGPGNSRIVFVAYVEDLIKKDNKFFAELKYSESPQILFILECPPELATKLLSRTQRLLDRVAVVAIISSVHKPAIKLEGGSSSNADEPSDVDVTTSSMFLARGVALDLEFLE